MDIKGIAVLIGIVGTGIGGYMHVDATYAKHSDVAGNTRMILSDRLYEVRRSLWLLEQKCGDKAIKCNSSARERWGQLKNDEDRLKRALDRLNYGTS